MNTDELGGFASANGLDLNVLIMAKSDLRKALQGDVLRVTFTKANGDVRVMLCTTMPEIIYAHKLTPREDVNPQAKNVNTDTPFNDNLFHVVDVEAESWRAFKYDTVISIERVG